MCAVDELIHVCQSSALLETNGVIVLDDIKHKPVQKCLRYIETNYPHYGRSNC